MSNTPDPFHAFTSPAHAADAKLPVSRKRIGVWMALWLALMIVSIICLGSYALALHSAVEHEHQEIVLLRHQVNSLLNQGH